MVFVILAAGVIAIALVIIHKRQSDRELIELKILERKLMKHSHKKETTVWVID